jgi:hypothetical protein
MRVSFDADPPLAKVLPMQVVWADDYFSFYSQVCWKSGAVVMHRPTPLRGVPIPDPEHAAASDPEQAPAVVGPPGTGEAPESAVGEGSGSHPGAPVTAGTASGGGEPATSLERGSRAPGFGEVLEDDAADVTLEDNSDWRLGMIQTVRDVNWKVTWGSPRGAKKECPEGAGRRTNVMARDSRQESAELPWFDKNLRSGQLRYEGDVGETHLEEGPGAGEIPYEHEALPGVKRGSFVFEVSFVIHLTALDENNFGSSPDAIRHLNHTYWQTEVEGTFDGDVEGIEKGTIVRADSDRSDVYKGASAEVPPTLGGDTAGNTYYRPVKECISNAPIVLVPGVREIVADVPGLSICE